MKKYVIFLFAFFAFGVQAEIYKWVDSAGNVHYGDQPDSSGAKKMKKLPGLSTYAPPQAPKKPETLEMETDVEDSDGEPVQAAPKEKFTYRELSIVSPDEGATVRSSPGSVTVFVALAPVLRKDDYLQVILDGTALKPKYHSTVLQLENVDRGEHRLVVAVYDKDGKKLLQSPTRVFQLHRTIARRPQPRG